MSELSLFVKKPTCKCNFHPSVSDRDYAALCVALGKRLETETAQVSVPINKERVVVERVTPQDAVRAVAPSSVNFGEGEVAGIETYEETPDIHIEALLPKLC